MRTLEELIRCHYVAACDEQRNLDEHDRVVVNALKKGSAKTTAIAEWMGHYRLFQHRPTRSLRNAVAQAFLDFADSSRPRWKCSDRSIASVFLALHGRLDAVEERRWLSATSKLLWCLYPDRVAMYDRFALRSLIVLRHLDPVLMRFPAIRETPARRDGETKEAARARYAAHYAQYQQMVYGLLAAHRSTLHELRKEHKERYPHDIRILDKLLWMMGNGNEKLSMAGTDTTQ